MERVPGNMKSGHLSLKLITRTWLCPLWPPLFLGTALNKQAHKPNLIVMTTDDLYFELMKNMIRNRVGLVMLISSSCFRYSWPCRAQPHYFTCPFLLIRHQTLDNGFCCWWKNYAVSVNVFHHLLVILSFLWIRRGFGSLPRGGRWHNTSSL